MSESSPDGVELTDEGSLRQVNYLVEFETTILGPYRAHTSEHALEQALADDDAPAETNGVVNVYESPIHDKFSIQTTHE